MLHLVGGAWLALWLVGFNAGQSLADLYIPPARSGLLKAAEVIRMQDPNPTASSQMSTPMGLCSMSS